MKKLNELYNCNYDVDLNDIKINSKEVKKGDLFVCIKGVTADRHDFIDEAIKNGASALMVSKDVKVDIPYIKVEDTNKELAILSKKFYDYPDEKLKLIAITGTDGKTSTATIIQTLIGKDNCGYSGTNGISYKNVKKDTPNTTPEVNVLCSYLKEFVDAGCKYASIETSSEAFYSGRLSSFEFDTSILTNITSEHLNTHGTLENYIDCKCKLFKQTKKDGISILNRDDKHFYKVLESCNSNVYTYGIGEENDLQIVSYKIMPNKTDIKFKYMNKVYDITSPLLADFNVYNLAAALLTCLKNGFKMDDLIEKIKDIRVDGRLSKIDLIQDYQVIVDYAHTPNGISKLLNFVKALDINKSIVVIGQAGERDKSKRPKVGKVVSENCDYAIFTYEDPRSEDPKDIINDIIRDIKKDNYEVVIDRREAIQRAINIAEKNDVVLILGKGNETYEKLKDKTIYFNDVEEAENAIRNRLGIHQKH